MLEKQKDVFGQHISIGNNYMVLKVKKCDIEPLKYHKDTSGAKWVRFGHWVAYIERIKDGIAYCRLRVYLNRENSASNNIVLREDSSRPEACFGHEYTTVPLLIPSKRDMKEVHRKITTNPNYITYEDSSYTKIKPLMKQIAKEYL